VVHQTINGDLSVLQFPWVKVRGNQIVNPEIRRPTESYEPLLNGLVWMIVASLVIKVGLEKQLSLDGVHYFFQILENRDFFYVAWSRRYAEYLIEWPLVLAVKAGLQDIRLLSRIFGFGILLVYSFSIVYSWYLVRKVAPVAIVFPVASYLIIALTGDYWFVGEHHVMTALSWPLLFLLLKKAPLRIHEWLLLLLIAGAFTRLYETSVLAIIVFLGCLVFRFLKTEAKGHRAGFVLVGVLLIIGACISIQFILFPVSGVNRGSFIDSIWRLEKIIELRFLGFALAALLFGWVLEVVGQKKLAQITYWIAIVPIGMYVISRVTTDYALTAYWSFSSRTLTGIALPLLLACTIWAYYQKTQVSRLAVQIFFVAATVFIFSNLVDQGNWLSVKADMKKITEQVPEGTYIDVWDTRLKGNHFRFTWNNPLLSVVWSFPCVRAVILNSPNEAGWQPFDPKKTAILKNYIKYSKKFTNLVGEIKRC
jgi:hypothetical protein